MFSLNLVQFCRHIEKMPSAVDLATQCTAFSASAVLYNAVLSAGKYTVRYMKSAVFDISFADSHVAGIEYPLQSVSFLLPERFRGLTEKPDHAVNRFDDIVNSLRKLI